ncbi:lipid A ABC transporter ATP-binding protein/permease MsbA [Endothiovibrio diazotrophicus]
MNNKQLYLRLLRQIRPYWKVFTLSFVSTVLLSATEPALPALMQPMLDGSFIEKDEQMIVLIPLLLVALFAVRGTASFTSTATTHWVASRLVTDLRQAMFGKLLRLPTAFHDHHPSGKLLSKFTYDVNQVTQAATSAWVILIRDSLSVLGLLGWMFYLNWRLALLSFVVVPVITVLVRVVSKRMRRLSHSMQDSMADLNQAVSEALEGHKEIKVFGAREYEERRFEVAANRARTFYNKTIATSAANVPLVQLFIAIGLALIVYTASIQSASDQFSVGGFVSFFTAMAMLFAPIKRLTKVNEDLQKGLAAAQSLFGLIDEEDEGEERGRPIGRARGQLTFEGLGFSYDGESAALSNIDLTIEPGQTVALVGASGSGKTTLVGLLPLFHRPSRGRILLDGEPITELRLRDLRANIALVSQQVVLFDDTVAANIAYGHAEFDPVRIEQAAEAAHAMEFIRRLPQGLETRVGERGVLLSGGQRQRIAIARALLKDAPILIMDEATANLDSHSERHIQAALETLTAGRTTLIIAHRLSTIERADRIVVLERGRIVEQGSHAELLARDGHYARLHRAQFGEADG